MFEIEFKIVLLMETIYCGHWSSYVIIIVTRSVVRKHSVIFESAVVLATMNDKKYQMHILGLFKLKFSNFSVFVLMSLAFSINVEKLENLSLLKIGSVVN